MVSARGILISFRPIIKLKNSRFQDLENSLDFQKFYLYLEKNFGFSNFVNGYTSRAKCIHIFKSPAPLE